MAPAVAVMFAPVRVQHSWFHGGIGDTRDLTLRVETTVTEDQSLRVVFPAIDGVLIKRLELTLRSDDRGTTVEALAAWATDHVSRGRPSGGVVDDVRGLVVLTPEDWWERRSLRGALLLFGRSSANGVEDTLFGEFVIPSF